MFQVSDQEFHELINQAMSTLPKEHVKNLKNIALLVEDLPTPDQRVKLKLNGDQTLLGLYEGVPLSQRQGVQKVLPDKITLFKTPLESQANSLNELKEQIRHTLWHEMAHYYGLDHPAIRALE
ncbi:MAG TPA: metallopeptidase family protein [Candidatus Saccharimonadales bacterium]|jgi:predicted Zn-dependent protease with MMP-like domain